MTTKFNRLLTGKSRGDLPGGARIYGTVKCDSVVELVQQKFAKVLCEITQVSARDRKKRYRQDTMAHLNDPTPVSSFMGGEEPMTASVLNTSVGICTRY